MASVKVISVVIDGEKLERAVQEGKGTRAAVKAEADSIRSRANSLGAAYPTERTVRWATREHVGGTVPDYRADVQTFRAKGGIEKPVGIVYTGNYAAMKDNHNHNTLLKAR